MLKFCCLNCTTYKVSFQELPSVACPGPIWKGMKYVTVCLSTALILHTKTMEIIRDREGACNAVRHEAKLRVKQDGLRAVTKPWKQMEAGHGNKSMDFRQVVWVIGA